MITFTSSAATCGSSATGGRTWRERARTGQLDVFLHDRRLDLVVRVGRDAHDAGRRVDRPAELLDVRRQVVSYIETAKSVTLHHTSFARTPSALTGQVEVRAEALAADARERRLDRAHRHVAHRVLEPDALDGVVVPQGLDLVRAVERPEAREAALLQERVQRREHGQELRERVGLVGVRAGAGPRGRGRPLVEEGDAEREVGEGRGGERFDEDVDHDVGVVEVGVELVPVGVF